jgi:hypothetical protein
MLRDGSASLIAVYSALKASSGTAKLPQTGHKSTLAYSRPRVSSAGRFTALPGQSSQTLNRAGSSADMGKLVLITLAVIFVLLVGGGVFLAAWDIPAPSSSVEKVIPDAKFPK